MRCQHVELCLGVEIYGLGAHELSACLAYPFAPVACQNPICRNIPISWAWSLNIYRGLPCGALQAYLYTAFSQPPLCFKRPPSYSVKAGLSLQMELLTMDWLEPSIFRMRYLSLVVPNTTKESSTTKANSQELHGGLLFHSTTVSSMSLAFTMPSNLNSFLVLIKGLFGFRFTNPAVVSPEAMLEAAAQNSESNTHGF